MLTKSCHLFFWRKVNDDSFPLHFDKFFATRQAISATSKGVHQRGSVALSWTRKVERRSPLLFEGDMFDLEALVDAFTLFFQFLLIVSSIDSVEYDTFTQDKQGETGSCQESFVPFMIVHGTVAVYPMPMGNQSEPASIFYAFSVFRGSVTRRCTTISNSSWILGTILRAITKLSNCRKAKWILPSETKLPVKTRKRKLNRETRFKVRLFLHRKPADLMALKMTIEAQNRRNCPPSVAPFLVIVFTLKSSKLMELKHSDVQWQNQFKISDPHCKGLG